MSFHSQYACYQNNARRGGNNTFSSSQVYGATGTGCRPGSRQGYRQGLSQCQTRSNYGVGWNSNTSNARAPNVFTFPQIDLSSGNFYAPSSSCKQQQQSKSSWTRPPASRYGSVTGRSNQLQEQPQQQFCNSPQAIKVNVSAAQLQNAQNTPIYHQDQDRGEPNSSQGQSENGNVKYIQLNWQDLLGGMENMRVSMMPSSDPSGNDNRQLKVSFGGGQGTTQAGETALKVLSISPTAASGGNNVTEGTSSSNGYYQQWHQQSQGQGYRGTCRR